MSDRLYEYSFYAGFNNAKAQAVDEVARLESAVFANPDLLAKTLSQIVSKYSLNLAELDIDNMSGERREEERRVPDHFGDYYTAKIKWMDVTIPFRGDSQSFQLSPTHCTLPSRQVILGNSSLTVSFTDGDNLQNDVDAFVDILKQNLSCLWSDYERVGPELELEVRQAAERRMRQIEGENERDKKLSFPVKK